MGGAINFRPASTLVTLDSIDYEPGKSNPFAWWRSDNLNLADGASLPAGGWPDSSGNGHALAPGVLPIFSQTGFNNGPGVVLNGTTQYLRAPAFFDASFASGAASFFFSAIPNPPNLTNPEVILAGGTWANFNVLLPDNRIGICTNGLTTNSVSNSFAGFVSLGGFPKKLVYGYRQSAAGIVNSYLNERRGWGNQFNVAGPIAPLNDDLYLGIDSTLLSAGYFYTGLVQEIIFFNRDVGDAEAALINRYLCRKAGLIGPQMIIDGDSMTIASQGTQTDNPMTYYMNAFPEYEVVCIASSGRGIDDRLANQPNWLAVKRPANSIAICRICTNDVLNGTSTAALHAKIATYHSNNRAAGLKTVVHTIPDCNAAHPPFSATAAADVVTLNNLIKANWTTYADGLIDSTTITQVNGTGAAANAGFFYSDGIHELGTAYALEKPVMIKAVRMAIDGIYPSDPSISGKKYLSSGAVKVSA